MGKLRKEIVKIVRAERKEQKKIRKERRSLPIEERDRLAYQDKEARREAKQKQKAEIKAMDKSAARKAKRRRRITRKVRNRPKRAVFVPSGITFSIWIVWMAKTKMPIPFMKEL